MRTCAWPKFHGKSSDSTLLHEGRQVRDLYPIGYLGKPSDLSLTRQVKGPVFDWLSGQVQGLVSNLNFVASQTTQFGGIKVGRSRELCLTGYMGKSENLCRT